MTRTSLLAGGVGRIATLADLKRWVKLNDWSRLIDSVVLYYFSFGKVTWQRKMAVEKVTAQYEVRRNDIVLKRKADRSSDKVKFTEA